MFCVVLPYMSDSEESSYTDLSSCINTPSNLPRFGSQLTDKTFTSSFGRIFSLYLSGMQDKLHWTSNFDYELWTACNIFSFLSLRISKATCLFLLDLEGVAVHLFI